MQTLHILLCLVYASVSAQDPDLVKTIQDLYGNNSRNNQADLIEVTSAKPNGYGAMQKCGEGDDQGTHVCIPYYQCDSVTNTVTDESNFVRHGKIDIRIGSGPCDDYLEVCCKLPTDTNRNPNIDVPVKPPVTPQPPTVTPTVPITPRPSSLQCGIRNSNGIDFTITGNKDNEAEYGEFPWMVAILKTNFDPTRDKTLSICGGSLIASNVILTGAHCVADLQLNQYKVRAGEWDTQTEKERLPYQERTVKQAIIHEGYEPKVLYNNVALLILNEPFTQADNIGTICLPDQGEIITSRNCFASGWGKDVFGKQGKYQVILKKIELPMVQHEACQQALRTTRLGPNFKLHPSFICAGGELGKDTCTGDGGSPLVCPDQQNPGRYIQSGIVSWGIGCGEKNIPGVYANVVKFRNWIDNTLSSLNIDASSYNL